MIVFPPHSWSLISHHFASPYCTFYEAYESPRKLKGTSALEHEPDRALCLGEHTTNNQLPETCLHI